MIFSDPCPDSYHTGTLYSDLTDFIGITGKLTPAAFWFGTGQPGSPAENETCLGKFC
jgi:hypothetical protein